MNILSLFDGISCGQIALNRANIQIDSYFASEIDKFAIQATQTNYPNTIQLGDINNYKSWQLPKIDLIMGGSPCQGFSFAGKQLAFNDPRSKLFFKFVDCLDHFQPRWFLLENVKMKKEYQDVITNLLKVEPMEINSALVSAQSRKRLYWFNWKVDQPKNKGILLKDILENRIVGRNYLVKCRRQIKLVPNYKVNKEKSCVIGKLSNGQGDRIFDINAKGSSLCVLGGGNGGGGCNIIIDPELNKMRRLMPIECERLQTVPDNYASIVSNSQRYKMLGNGWTVDVIVHILKGIELE